MNGSQIKGVMVPVLTPLTPNEDVDVQSLVRLVNYLIENGVHGIWAAGTNGEFASLTNKQHVICIKTVVNATSGRVPVIGNISAASTKTSIEIGKAVDKIGLDGIAATPPYYYLNSQDELLEHFRYIKLSLGMPLWIYNIPPNVKAEVEASTIVDLALDGTIAGIKDSSGAGEKFANLRILCEEKGIDPYRFLGTVNRITSAGSLGAHGVIPGLGNFVPNIASLGWESGETSDAELAREYNNKLILATKISRLAKAGSAQASSISGMKSALKIMGVIDNDTVTRPLRPLKHEEKKTIPELIEELGLEY